jgi:hypothetical protein
MHDSVHVFRLTQARLDDPPLYKPMKHTFWIWISIVAISAGACAQTLPNNPQPAPSGTADWVPVQDLANGQLISVARSGTSSVPCRFAGATNDTLFCNSLFTGMEYRFNRDEIERVRLDDKRRNLRLLVGGLAAVGFVWGVATPNNDGTPRFVNGLAGAGAGALAGIVVSVPVALFVPGRLVYRHPGTERKSAASEPRARTAP